MKRKNPFNTSSCYKMFNLYDEVDNLNFSIYICNHRLGI